jgi:ubiquinone/menaquinone biosynthesis C-methylase UbiE
VKLQPPAAAGRWARYSPAFARFRGADRRRTGTWVRRMQCLLAGQSCASGVLLDVGCGSARFLRPLAAHFDLSVGVDREPAMLGLARRALLRPQGGGCALLRAEAGRLPLRDGCADLVLASMLLEHVDDPAAVLSDLARVLAGGGLLLLRLMLPDDVDRSDWYRCSAAARRIERARCLDLAAWRALAWRQALDLVCHAGFADRIDPRCAGSRSDRVRAGAYEVLHRLAPLQRFCALRRAERLDAARRPEVNRASLLLLCHAGAARDRP